MNDTKHTKTLISGAFGNSSDFWVGRQLIIFLPTDLKSPMKNFFFLPRGWKKFAVALNFMGRSGKWQDISVDIKTLSPVGCLPLPWVYIHVLTHEKNGIKSDFKWLFWNLQQMTKVTRCSRWHQNFVPKGMSAPAQRLYTCTFVHV